MVRSPSTQCKAKTIRKFLCILAGHGQVQFTLCTYLGTTSYRQVTRCSVYFKISPLEGNQECRG